MIAATPTGTVAGERTLPPVARELWWLPGSRLSIGEGMPDRAALIEAQIPGLRRSPARYCAATGRRPTTSFRILLNARFPIGIYGGTKEI